jgi:hypothetical protein
VSGGKSNARRAGGRHGFYNGTISSFTTNSSVYATLHRSSLALECALGFALAGTDAPGVQGQAEGQVPREAALLAPALAVRRGSPECLCEVTGYR